VFRKVEKIAPTDISVLITGETGTGKELIAREIHARSPRAGKPFVTINCGAIPENLLESELFGHVKGAFTGAVANKQGKFQAADGGTLFLDEIGEMPLELQVKLLRAIQERVVVRVGDTRAESVDIRILAATNRDLEKEIAGGRFREDLYYRLNVVNLQLPPLRARGEDVIVIARYLLSRYTREFDAKVKGFSPNASVAMRKHNWPGNIRELENRIKKAIVLCESTVIGPDDLGLTADSPAGDPHAGRGQGQVPARLHQRGAGGQQRQPHQDRARPRRRPAHDLPPPRERGGCTWTTIAQTRRQRARRVASPRAPRWIEPPLATSRASARALTSASSACCGSRCSTANSSTAASRGFAPCLQAALRRSGTS
jgi:transcriptional regulator with PAS, ATPase and Fis domain